MTEDEPYKIGYKMPPRHTQFGAGVSGNAPGKTSIQKKQEYANAEKASLVRGRMLDALIEATKDNEKAALEFIEAGVLKLLKDAEDRGFGTAQQSINHTSDDRSMSPTRELSDAELQAVIDANADPK
jgi:hypothetical protein